MVSELQTQTVGSTLGWSQFTKGHNSVKTLSGVMLLVLCTLFNDALNLYQSFKKTSQRVSELLSRCHVHTEIYKGT